MGWICTDCSNNCQVAPASINFTLSVVGRSAIGIRIRVQSLSSAVELNPLGCLSPLFRYAELQESGKYKGQYKLSSALDALRKARNAIEHKEAVLTPDEVKEFLCAAFVFLDTFVSEELGLSLKTEMDNLDEVRAEELLDDGVEVDDIEQQNTYRTLSMAYLFYIQHMQRFITPSVELL